MKVVAEAGDSPAHLANVARVALRALSV